MTFIYTGIPETLCDLLYGDIHFIVVVWIWNHNSSEECQFFTLQEEEFLLAQHLSQWEIVTMQPMKSHYTSSSHFSPMNSVYNSPS